jgi:inhibitor of cysteine peptidase
MIMKNNIVGVALCLVLVGAALATLQCTAVYPGPVEINRFSSYEELREFVNENTQDKGMLNMPGRFWSGAAEEDALAPASGASDYSATNIQVAGVDEADIVKTDGEYIYLVSGNKTIIVRAYPPVQAQIVSEIELEEP